MIEPHLECVLSIMLDYIGLSALIRIEQFFTKSLDRIH